ncbi:MAG: leucine-rich repeat domain-containing protein [Bacteroidetes bacterium]|nr:MAG: leucine-rich repeat domain-containing protein [Bacteroidota bacterium]
MKIFRPLSHLFLFIGLFLVHLDLRADSPLTSTYFAKVYEDVKLVQKAIDSDGQLNEEQVLFLSDGTQDIGSQMALINALGWNSNGKNNAQTFFRLLQKKQGYKSMDEFLQQGEACAIMSLAYLKSMDNYFDVRLASHYAYTALKKNPRSFTIQMVTALIESQTLMNSSFCEVWMRVDQVRQNRSLNSDFRPKAIEAIHSYIVLYKDYCQTEPSETATDEVKYFSGMKQALAHASQVKHLEIYVDEVDLLTENIERLPGLKDLTIYGHLSGQLSQSIGKLSQITHLELTFDSIQSIPGALGSLHRLESLTITAFNISKIPRQIGHLKSLTSLKLVDSKLQKLPRSIGKLRRLKMLQLSGNQLRSLPNTIGRLQRLEILELSNNQLESLPKSFGKLRALKQLDLRNNQLNQLPDCLFDFQQLSSLWLGKNGIPEEEVKKLQGKLRDCHIYTY